FLTTVMDTLGSELEAANAELASSLLSNHGWTPGRHRPPADQVTHGYSKYQDPTVPRNEGIGMLTRILGKNPVTNTIDLLSNVSKSTGEDSKTMSMCKIPNTKAGLKQWMKDKMGFVPRFWGRIAAVDVQRVVCFVLWLYLLSTADDVSEQQFKPTLGKSDKIVLAYVYFTATKNGLLAGHMALLAKNAGVSASKLTDAVEKSRVGTTTEGLDLIEYAIKMSAPVARRDASLVYKFAEQLPAIAGPEHVTAIIELLALWGLCSMLQRMSVGLDDEAGYEREVLNLVGSTFGKELELQEDGGVVGVRINESVVGVTEGVLLWGQK
ncbi:hypothetical protein HDU76_011640, partial [Blyttiomyces sp. JEL0837]